VDTRAHVLQPVAVQLVLPLREQAHQVVLDRETVPAAKEGIRQAGRPETAVPVGVVKGAVNSDCTERRGAQSRLFVSLQGVHDCGILISGCLDYELLNG
jgi:hypothetical protein